MFISIAMFDYRRVPFVNEWSIVTGDEQMDVSPIDGGFLLLLPSGKRAENYATSTCFMGKSTVSMAMASIAMLDYRNHIPIHCTEIPYSCRDLLFRMVKTVIIHPILSISRRNFYPSWFIAHSQNLEFVSWDYEILEWF